MEPVFLIGAGRSGTKFLRDVLAHSSEIAKIPYDVGYIWRYSNEGLAHDEFEPILATEAIKAYIRKTLPKLVDSSESSGERYFIEKSVPNALRPKFVHEIFPNARFIHLIRDGRSVVESSMRLWKSPPDKGYLLAKLKYFPITNYKYAFWYSINLFKGLLKGRGQRVWGPRYIGMEDDSQTEPLETICSKQWKKCVDNSLEQLAQVPDSQVITVRYEDLMSSESEILRILDFLDVDSSSAAIEFYNKTLRPGTVQQWSKKLSAKQLSLIMNEIEPTLKRTSYL